MTDPAGLDDVLEDPFAQFDRWMRAAEASEPVDPNAMALATAGPDGMPDVRMVLLKGFDTAGFVFYTNANSGKGSQLIANMQAAAVLHWKSLGRQVRLRGAVHHASDAEADAYFATRSRNSQIGAWASMQSRQLGSRAELEQAVAMQESRFASGPVPRPEHWSGFRIVPVSMEFWTNGEARLHNRLVFRRATPSELWTHGLLYP